MKTKQAVIGVCVAALFASSAAIARDKWDYSEGAWDKTQSYGQVTVAQDSVQQWGPWEQFVEPAAGAPSGVQFAGAGSGDLYRPILVIPEAPRIVTGPFEQVGGSGIVRGQLTWTTTTDLDFHLIVPGGGHVAYYRPTVTFNGGAAVARLDHDNLGGTIDVQPNLRVENIVVTGTPAVGAYSFYVHRYSGPTSAATVLLTGDGGVTSRTYTPTVSGTSPTYTVNYNGPGVAPTYAP